MGHYDCFMWCSVNESLLLYIYIYMYIYIYIYIYQERINEKMKCWSMQLAPKYL